MTAILLNILFVVINLISLSFEKSRFWKAFLLCAVYINLSCVLILLYNYETNRDLMEQIISAQDITIDNQSKTIANYDTIIGLQDELIFRMEGQSN